LATRRSAARYRANWRGWSKYARRWAAAASWERTKVRPMYPARPAAAAPSTPVTTLAVGVEARMASTAKPTRSTNPTTIAN